MRRILCVFAAVLLSLTVVLAGPGTAGASVAPTRQQSGDATTQNIPFCSGMYWERKSSSTVRLWAPSATVRKYLGTGVYGLVWVTVHDSRNRLVDSGRYNASRHMGFDFRVSAPRNSYVAISLTNDSNTSTKCRAGKRVP